MNNTARIIGLTGGIGAGKSAAAARFQALGARVIDADVLARAALDANSACYQEVLDAFGHEILLESGAINRRALADIVFADEKKRKTLNDIVHPRVIADMLRQAKIIIRADAAAIVVLDVPLLFECGMEKTVDCSILVYTDDALRIGRIVKRDDCSTAEAEARIRAQMPQSEKRALADYILENGGPMEALWGQTDAVYQLFRSRLY